MVSSCASNDDIAELLEQLGLSSLLQHFKDQEVDMDALLKFGPEEFLQLLPKMGPRIKIQNWVEERRSLGMVLFLSLCYGGRFRHAAHSYRKVFNSVARQLSYSPSS